MNAVLAQQNDATEAFRFGMADVLGRALALDFAPRRVVPVEAVDARPGWMQDADNLRGDWEAVGGYMRGAIGRFEEENPGLVREGRLRETGEAE